MSSSTRRNNKTTRRIGRHSLRHRLMQPEYLEDRIVLAVDLNPTLEPAIVNGLDDFRAAADAIDQLDRFTASLPVVGQSIGHVLDFGGQFRDEIVIPIQNYLATNDPTTSTALVEP